jgi:hypothetical protein
VYFGKHQPRIDSYTHFESGAFLLIYVRFIYFVCDQLTSECLVLYLYNKSLITERQFPVDGLFDYVYCVYVSLDSRFHSRSTGRVGQVEIHMNECGAQTNCY